MKKGQMAKQSVAEKALKKAVVTFFMEHQRFPTVRECLKISPYKSTCGVFHTLIRLEKRGFLKSITIGKTTHYSIIGMRILPPDWYVEVKNGSR